MKPISQMLQRLRSTFAPRRGKKGSSLALVMMIGAVLVIWVMCIMPLMTTTGTITYQTQGSYDDYLQSRSVIEFCKSELEKIVEEKIPYTFAVTGNVTEENFAAVPKYNVTGQTVRPEYAALVNSPDALDDRKDVPSSDEVAAICAVEPSRENPNIYDIIITTYENCEEQMKYTATFTPKGSLMIHPEAYKQNQALPLSDFVVVDGKMGPNTVWNSGITMQTADSLDFNEVLLPLIDASHSDWHAGYANTGEYPAVFKTTANAAYKDGANITDPVTMGDLSSDQNWIMPKTGTTSENGNIWYSLDGNTLQIMMYANGNVNITEDCIVYLNGAVTRDYSVPAHGIYTVSIDYKGTDYSTDENLEKYDPEQVNVLPISGLKLVTNKATEINRVSTGKHTLSENISMDVEKVDYTNDQGEVVETTYTVTLTQPESADLVYCVTDSQGQNITWTESNVFEGLSNAPGTAYFFYACRPASYVDGVFMADSDVKYVGMLYAPKFVNSLTNNSKYSILGVTDGGYYALTSGADVTAVPADHGFIKNSYDAWTAISDNNGWSLRNSSNKYLRINATADPQYTEETVENHGQSIFDWDGHTCTKYSCSSCNWSFSVGIGNNMALTVASVNNTSDFTVSRTDSHTEKYREYECSYRKDKEITFTRTEYLSLNGSVSTSEETATVRFMELPPAAPSTPASPSKTYTIGDTVTYGTNVLNHVGSAVGSDEIVALYANGQQVNNILNAGSYHMVVKVKNGERETWANLGILTVAKYNLDNSEVTVTAERHAVDELRVDLSAAGWHENSGTKYFGYKKTSDSAYHWFATNDSEYTFRLEYGTYQFAVKESGNVNYNGVESAAVEVAIEMNPVDLVAEDKPFFIYMMDDETGEITWYKLPKGILPGGETNRVLFVYGYSNNYTNSIDWTTEYKGQSYQKDVWIVVGTVKVTYTLTRYAVYVEESNFDKDDDLNRRGQLQYTKMFEIEEPLEYGYVADRAPSMMRGSSLYFMGTSGSINTYGTAVELTTDLLVLNSDIIGGGYVYVKPYGSQAANPGDTLLFIANTGGIVREGNVIFEGRTFYRIPIDTDLCNVDAVTAAGWKVGTVMDEDVKYLFRQGVFPEVNLDIAYADRAQLSRIINSETIGWTDDGILAGSSNSSNPGYAITAYITGMNGEVSYKANRILIAGKCAGVNALNVTSDLAFTTRYLSVDAEQIEGSGTKFMLYNLAQDQGFVQWISNALGLTNYSSKSLQMDYERPTMIISDAGTITMPTQICRYDHGTNLLGNATNMSLMAEYTTSEIENLFENGFISSILGSTVKTVDRYVSLKADNASGTIDIDSWLSGSQLDIYANYVYVDSSVKKINMSSWFGGNDIRVSSQESGYTTQEYLGIFKGHSAETYTGTILYFSGYVQINLGRSTKTVAPGFYWIQATDNGTSLAELADNPADHAIDPEELKDYSIYINPDGSLSNAYVDTGLLDNNSVGAGGFSGGSMG